MALGRILVVDDEESMCQYLSILLKKEGYEVLTVNSGQEALQVFETSPVDLVMTDMTMPQMTGVKLSEKIMGIRPDIPVIICTGYSSLVNEESAKLLGIAAYVMKPIDSKEIAATIRAVLDKKKL